MLRFLRPAGLLLALCTCSTAEAFAQIPQLVISAPTPAPTRSDAPLLASTAIEERGLALWSGSTSDVGVGVTLSSHRWTIRSITSQAPPPIGSERRPGVQQVDVVRPLISGGKTSVSAGGGVRQEWDGTSVLIGRVLVGRDVGHGRLHASVVMERAMSSPLKRDAEDVVTTFGWSKRLGDQISVGAESIGQDLEGLWNPREADGGAKLFIGPSLHLQSPRGGWSGGVTAGPVVHRAPTGHHLGLFVSATWTPVRHH